MGPVHASEVTRPDFGVFTEAQTNALIDFLKTWTLVFILRDSPQAILDAERLRVWANKLRSEIPFSTTPLLDCAVAAISIGEGRNAATFSRPSSPEVGTFWGRLGDPESFSERMAKIPQLMHFITTNVLLYYSRNAVEKGRVAAFAWKDARVLHSSLPSSCAEVPEIILRVFAVPDVGTSPPLPSSCPTPETALPPPPQIPQTNYVSPHNTNQASSTSPIGTSCDRKFNISSASYLASTSLDVQPLRAFVILTDRILEVWVTHRIILREVLTDGARVVVVNPRPVSTTLYQDPLTGRLLTISEASGSNGLNTFARTFTVTVEIGDVQVITPTSEALMIRDVRDPRSVEEKLLALQRREENPSTVSASYPPTQFGPTCQKCMGRGWLTCPRCLGNPYYRASQVGPGHPIASLLAPLSPCLVCSAETIVVCEACEGHGIFTHERTMQLASETPFQLALRAIEEHITFEAWLYSQMQSDPKFAFLAIHGPQSVKDSGTADAMSLDPESLAYQQTAVSARAETVRLMTRVLSFKTQLRPHEWEYIDRTWTERRKQVMLQLKR